MKYPVVGLFVCLTFGILSSPAYSRGRHCCTPAATYTANYEYPAAKKPAQPVAMKLPKEAQAIVDQYRLALKQDIAEHNRQLVDTLKAQHVNYVNANDLASASLVLQYLQKLTTVAETAPPVRNPPLKREKAFNVPKPPVTTAVFTQATLLPHAPAEGSHQAKIAALRAAVDRNLKSR